MPHISSIISYGVRALMAIALLSVTLAVHAGDTYNPDNDKRPLRFAWGAEITGGAEMAGHDMSDIGLNASFGMQWKWLRFLGAVAEADIMVNKSARSFPLAVCVQSDFSQRRRLLFMDLRGGIALNYYDGNTQTTDPYASAGLGVTLAKGRTYSTHIILAYTYLGRKTCFVGNRERSCPGMSYATLRFGVRF